MEGKVVRRRLIQSTLFPHTDSSIKNVEDCDVNRQEEEAGEEEEWCGSSKSRRGSKRKGNSKSKTTPPASLKKVIENGKEISSNQVADSGSPVIAKSSFFVKASERRKQKQQQKQLVSIDSPEENNEICSTPCSVTNGRSTPRKQKRQDSSTPRKERRNSTPNKKTKSGYKELCSGQIPFDLTVDEQPSRTIPDLRLEAKLTAEENSRIFAGRQIHPFFKSWKGGKSSQDLTDSDRMWSSFERKEKGIAFNPIHVFENVEGDPTALNWGQWVFYDRSANGDLECGCSPVYEGSVNSLTLDNYQSVSHDTRSSLYQNYHQCSVPKDVSMRLSDISECTRPPSSLFLDENGGPCIKLQKQLVVQPKVTEDLLAASVESMLQDHKLEKIDFFDGIPCRGSLESESRDRLLQERIMSHYHTCQNQPENCLWTDKYQPQNAKQICGNGEAVKYLSEWLHRWHSRGPRTTRGCMDEYTSIVQDIDHDYQQSESDTDDGEESLKNVLLVTGPVGSGKSASIYACARDQGFQIIEINASDWRNGALVKQKFGEAVESHWLQRTAENTANSEQKVLSKFSKMVNPEVHSSANEVIELIHIPDEENSQDAGSSLKMSASGCKKTANCQNGVKTLILFEDVDATLCEDHGFITTIHQLAQTAKRPMILTSNSDNPVLPKNLDRFDLSFSVPSVEELLGLVHMICAAEKAKVLPCLVEKFVDHCQGDIRKTIMLLQFWFQGQTLGIDNKLHTAYWPVLFDLDAGHYVLPKLIEWGHPSELSELVAEEIVKSLSLMEENHGLIDTKWVEDLNDYARENIHMQNAVSDPVEVKKTTMLSLQSSLDDVECALFEDNIELSDFSCSPVAFARQNRRRNTNTVLSSDSEDEFSWRSITLVSAGGDINAEALDMQKTPTSEFLLTTEIDQLPTRPDSLEEDHCHLEERVYCSHVEETYQSHEISFVPESLFVPETEVIHEGDLYSVTVSYGDLLNAVAANSPFQDQESLPATGAQPTTSFQLFQKEQETIGQNSDTIIPCVYEEEVGDSLSKSEADVPRGYQLLDECSRVDFMRSLKSLDKPEADQVTDFVKETWKRLHVQHNDLRKYITAEEKTVCRALRLTHGMSNLISEADLLLKDCQTLLSDSLGSSMVPSERMDSYSYYDNQLDMSSILTEHGMCYYAKEITSLGSILGSTSTSDLASEMLSSSASSVALGKLACQNQIKVDRSNMRTTKCYNLLTRKTDSSICDVLQSIVPPRSYLAVKGDSFHEYVSTLSQISRYEASRLSGCIDNTRKQRRLRVPIHYLSSGSLSMSSEEISLLSRCNSYQKSSCLVRDESFRYNI